MNNLIIGHKDSQLSYIHKSLFVFFITHNTCPCFDAKDEYNKLNNK